MYVCVCKGITDSHIRGAVASGVTNYRQLRESLGIADQCGRCGVLARQIFRESLPADNGPALFYPAALAVA